MDLLTVQSAVEAAITRIGATGAVLDVDEDARKILGVVDNAGDHSYDEIALALIKAATRRQIAIVFDNPNP